MKRPLIALAALAAAGTALAAPAAAETMAVQYRDLNLATAQGQKVLERRIDRAARKVCDRGVQRTGTRLPSAKVEACYRQAKAKANQTFAALVEAHRLGG